MKNTTQTILDKLEELDNKEAKEIARIFSDFSITAGKQTPTHNPVSVFLKQRLDINVEIMYNTVGICKKELFKINQSVQNFLNKFDDGEFDELWDSSLDRAYKESDYSDIGPQEIRIKDINIDKKTVKPKKAKTYKPYKTQIEVMIQPKKVMFREI